MADFTREEPGTPKVVDRAMFHAELDTLRVREKAHTHEGDAIAAARRRLPMVEVDATTKLIGQHGPVTLIDAFEGRRQLIAYYFMWHTGHPAPEQCEGCTWVTAQVCELSYLHSRDVTFAVFCQGPYEESARYRDFMGWQIPWYSALDSLDTLLIGRRIGRMHIVCYLRQRAKVFETYWTTARGVEVMDNSYHLLDLTVYGRQEKWGTRRSAGHNSAPTPAPAAARRLGNRSGQADALSHSGRDSQRGAPIIWEAVGAEPVHQQHGNALHRTVCGRAKVGSECLRPGPFPRVSFDCVCVVEPPMLRSTHLGAHYETLIKASGTCSHGCLPPNRIRSQSGNVAWHTRLADGNAGRLSMSFTGCSSRPFISVAPPVCGLDIIRMVVPPRSSHAFRVFVVRNDIAVFIEVFLADCTFSVLFGDLSIQQLSHLSG
jgi:predicted dithiol-disulfide oxidoreductase (DUF899 family)